MLGNPSMFTQITERTRGGFESLLSVINQEAAMFQQNRELAKRQAAAMELKRYEADLDFQKARAIEEVKAEVAAQKPISNDSRIRLELERQNRVQNEILDSDRMKARFGYNQIVSRMIEGPGGAPTFVDFGVRTDPTTGEFKYERVDLNPYFQHAPLFKTADKISDEINSVLRAGLPQDGLTVGGQKYIGRSDLESILIGLNADVPRDVAIAVAQYENIKGTIPTVDLIKAGGEKMSETQRKGVIDFRNAKGKFKTYRDGAQPFLETAYKDSGPIKSDVYANMPVGFVQLHLRKRLDAYLMEKKGVEAKVIEDSTIAPAYIAIKRYHDYLDEMTNNYLNLPGAKTADFSELYLNPNSTTETDFFVLKSGLPQQPRMENNTQQVTDRYINSTNTLLNMFFPIQPAR